MNKAKKIAAKAALKIAITMLGGAEGIMRKLDPEMEKIRDNLVKGAADLVGSHDQIGRSKVCYRLDSDNQIIQETLAWIDTNHSIRSYWKARGTEPEGGILDPQWDWCILDSINVTENTRKQIESGEALKTLPTEIIPVIKLLPKGAISPDNMIQVIRDMVFATKKKHGIENPSIFLTPTKFPTEDGKEEDIVLVQITDTKTDGIPQVIFEGKLLPTLQKLIPEQIQHLGKLLDQKEGKEEKKENRKEAA